MFDQPQPSLQQEIDSENRAPIQSSSRKLIDKSQSNAHIESSNRLEIPRGFSPQLFNIEIKKNTIED
jgi:hypothetical protein